VKYIRFASFLFAAVLLAAACIGTVGEIASWVGTLRLFEVVFNDPSILVAGYYDACAELRMNYQFFGENGPMLVLGLLVLILINAIT
jgi:hypothetical protein